jgi:RHS repeat-associated protein
MSADALGTVALVSNATDTVQNSYVFDAWGATRASTTALTNSFGYTARELGDAGLLAYRARYLQTGVGRFTQEDPIESVGAASAYAYAFNRAISLRDPSGMNAIPIPLQPSPRPCPDCTKADPLPYTSPVCDKYGSETHLGASMSCVCKCAGGGSWNNHVRGCLACEHDLGTNNFVAHARCYSASGPDAPYNTLSACYMNCLVFSPPAPPRPPFI